MAKEKAKESGKGRVKFVTHVLRVCFNHIDKPNMSKFGKGLYEITGLNPKTKLDDLKPMKQAVLSAARQLWPEITYKELKTPFRDGDTKNEERKAKGQEKYPCYVDNIFFKATNKNKPGVIGVGKDGKPVDLPEGTSVYGGCYCRLSLVVKAYEMEKPVEKEDKNGKITTVNKLIKGVTFYIQNVQFIKDGEPFGGGASDPEDDFEGTVDVKELDLGAVDEDEDFEDKTAKSSNGKNGKKKEADDDDEVEDEDEGDDAII